MVKNFFFVFELVEAERPREMRRAGSGDAVLTRGLEQALQAEASSLTSRRCCEASATANSDAVNTGGADSSYV